MSAFVSEYTRNIGIASLSVHYMLSKWLNVSKFVHHMTL